MRFWKSRKFLVLTSVAFIVSGLIFYFFYGMPWNLITYKGMFESYLENKYEEDFVIAEISYDLLHGGGTYHAYAYSKNNPEVMFYVGQNVRQEELEDSYHYEMWRFQAHNEWTPIIEEIFPTKFNHSVEVRDFLDPTDTESSTLSNYKDMVTLEIGVAMNNTTITRENKETELRKVYKLLEDLNKRGVNLHHFGVDYKNKTLQLNNHEVRSVKQHGDLVNVLMDYK
ncbi:hypothetical protein JOC85_003423 [Bacillus mesophilus]|uniref:Uncharacterized protein n=1 Tax=Bacillus mesophilus TaxID=1808955 RepID=A0A6M0QC97_9BACI|nr:hypothetical protein [Bacillus mesophilus]MBM7662613.1 hypothetical protein [Bacillus mesophilus]NEY73319.1 hypothetical protein [Bacillus mesophilus]